MPDGTSARVCRACSAQLCGITKNAPRLNAPLKMALERGGRLETGLTNTLKFWVVVSGTAATCVVMPDGRRQITSIEMPGTIICCPTLGPDKAMWLEALSTCEICEIDMGSTLQALQFDANILMSLFRIMHSRMQQSAHHIATLGRLDSTERVILFLAEMSLRQDEKVVHLTMSREDIADFLGLNTETVSRIFSRLKKNGMFSFLSPTEYVVRDFDAIMGRLPVEPVVPNPVPLETRTPLSDVLGCQAMENYA